MLSVYTRHYLPCRQTDGNYRRCRCPKWINGNLSSGKFVRISALTRSWEQAQRNALELDAGTEPLKKATIESHSRITVEQAVREFLADEQARKLAKTSTCQSVTLLKNQLLEWARKQALTFIDQLTTPRLREFRAPWGNSAVTTQRKHHRLNGFFDFCIESDWSYTLVRFVYLDAVTLERSRLHADRLLLYRHKTKVPVYVPLPPTVTKMLDTLPNSNARYFFWSGNGDPHTAKKCWQRSLRLLFRTVKLMTEDGEPKRCHPHMFRDTFAVELLLAGVPLDQVSLLLGHSSIKITERHYSPFVKARQQQLELSARMAWGSTERMQTASKAVM